MSWDLQLFCVLEQITLWNLKDLGRSHGQMVKDINLTINLDIVQNCFLIYCIHEKRVLQKNEKINFLHISGWWGETRYKLQIELERQVLELNRHLELEQ